MFKIRFVIVCVSSHILFTCELDSSAVINHFIFISRRGLVYFVSWVIPEECVLWETNIWLNLKWMLIISLHIYKHWIYYSFIFSLVKFMIDIFLFVTLSVKVCRCLLWKLDEKVRYSVWNNYNLSSHVCQIRTIRYIFNNLNTIYLIRQPILNCHFCQNRKETLSLK